MASPRLAGDRAILYAGAFLRSVGTGLIGVLLGIYLAKLHFDAARVGAVVTLGLAGAAGGALLVTLAADRLGRRRALIALAVVGAAGTLAAALASRAAVMGAAAFVGMLNGMGRDRGASSILDQAILPATAGDDRRTLGFAWYGILQEGGHALGALLAGAPSLLRGGLHVPELTAFRAVLGAVSALLLVTAVLYTRLSPDVEAPPHAARAPLSPESRRILTHISTLFAVDSLGGGFLTASLLSFFFFERFAVAEGAIAVLFFAARLANAASQFGAAWLARRIGLVNTMVYTHLPSSLLLVAVAFTHSFPVAAALFLAREALVQMDVPTRQSYVMAMVAPHERTFAAGVSNLVRLGGWAVAPAAAGLLMRGAALGAPLVVGAGTKIAYDLMLYVAFRHKRPPEEAASASPVRP